MTASDGPPPWWALLYERMLGDLARALGISEADARNRYPARETGGGEDA